MNHTELSTIFPQLVQFYNLENNQNQQNQQQQQLKFKTHNNIYYQKIRSHSYFKHIQALSSSQSQQENNINNHILQSLDLDTYAQTLFTKAKIIKIKKGTLLYTPGGQSDYGYFLINGTVQLLSKKTIKQKLQNQTDHTLYSTQQKLNYLNQKFNIKPQKAEILISQFYEEKILFKFLPFKTIYGEGYFGISQLLKNAYRNFMAIATADSQLIVFSKEAFNQTLKELEQKKQLFILSKILDIFPKDSIDQIKSKMSQIFQTVDLKILQHDECLFKVDSLTKYIYFIIEGEVQMRKKIIFQIPKQYIKHQNKNQIKKEIDSKVAKIGQGNLVGQCQVLLRKKQRQFSAISSSNKSIILQIDSTTFLKAISQNPYIQKDLTLSCKNKLIIWKQSFEKQHKKLRKAFLGQFEKFETKKKQKMLNDFLHDDVGIKNQFYQIFTSDGLFYRDTFQKLQGFDFNSPPQTVKRAAIKRRKGCAPGQDPFPVTNPHMHQYDLQTEQKMLMSSPHGGFTQNDFNKATNNTSSSKIAFIEDYNSLPNQENLEKESSKKIQLMNTAGSNMFKKSQALKKSKSSVNKFRQIQKDEEIYKKVLIKNGLFPIDRKIDNSNTIKAIVNHKFDDIVKKCISRKNPGLKRFDQGKRQELIKQSYDKIKSTLKNKSFSLSQFTSYTVPCRGTQQMKKRMKSMSKSSKRNQGQLHNKTPFNSQGLQDCIGVNQKPKSSNVKFRTYYEVGHGNNGLKNSGVNFMKSSQRSFGSNGSNGRVTMPERIVLLNHMMKPIIYSSSLEL